MNQPLWSSSSSYEPPTSTSSPQLHEQSAADYIKVRSQRSGLVLAVVAAVAVMVLAGLGSYLLLGKNGEADGEQISHTTTPQESISFTQPTTDKKVSSEGGLYHYELPHGFQRSEIPTDYLKYGDEQATIIIAFGENPAGPGNYVIVYAANYNASNLDNAEQRALAQNGVYRNPRRIQIDHKESLQLDYVYGAGQGLTNYRPLNTEKTLVITCSYVEQQSKIEQACQTVLKSIEVQQ